MYFGILYNERLLNSLFGILYNEWLFWMGTLETHLKLYRLFKKDANNDKLYAGTQMEAFFLSAFHLIDACAAKNRLHINKHQKVRDDLQRNNFIFGNETEFVWRKFQLIENQLRPKFVYSASWGKADVAAAKNAFNEIETICLKVLADAG